MVSAARSHRVRDLVCYRLIDGTRVPRLSQLNVVSQTTIEDDERISEAQDTEERNQRTDWSCRCDDHFRPR